MSLDLSSLLAQAPLRKPRRPVAERMLSILVRDVRPLVEVNQQAGDVGQPSVLDMIRVLGGQKNPRQVWERLTESHSEVVPKCDNLRFPGPGQRETPVARTKEDAYYIPGLLPCHWEP